MFLSNMNVSVQCNMDVSEQYECFRAIWMFLCNMNVSVQYGCFFAICMLLCNSELYATIWMLL